MKFYSTAALAAATVPALGLVGPSSAFQPTAVRHAAGLSPRTRSSLASAPEPTGATSPCALPDGPLPDAVTAKGLRSAVLTTADGERVALGERMGRGTSIVVFLRHLG